MATEILLLPAGTYAASDGDPTGLSVLTLTASITEASLTVGQTASLTTNATSGTATYQWKRDGVNISGATSATYVTQAADSGTDLTCAVTSGLQTVTTAAVTVGAAAAGIVVKAVGGGVVLAGTGTTNITIPGTPADGDLVLVWSAKDDPTSTPPLASGYTSAYGTSNTNNTAARLQYKFMTATPDSVVTLAQVSGGSAEDQAVLVALISGVNVSPVLDVAIPTASTGNGNTITPPAITTANDGALVGIFGVLDDRGSGGGATLSSSPSGYSDLAEQATPGSDGAACRVVCGFKEIPTAGTETPGSWTFTGTDQWQAISVALRAA